MTRTARSSFPRAVVRDRSESKSGLDKSIRKNGGGGHNWGSLADEQHLEFAAMGDEELDFDDSEETHLLTLCLALDDKKPGIQRTNSALTQEEIETAKKFRKNALKADGIDLSAIARTSSALSTSPP
ncbi:hypothetical protein BDZ94DRAFT_1143023, partial [Collybia nuda]